MPGMDPNRWPRLTGKFWYSHPVTWTMLCNDHGLSLLPAPLPRGLVGFFLALAVIVGFGSIPIALFATGKLGLAVLIGLTFAVAFALGAQFVRYKHASQQRLGPMLEVSTAGSEIRLPRERRCWTLHDIVRWEVLSGTRVWRKGQEPIVFDDISELHLVVSNSDGSEEAWPIAGAPGRDAPELVEAGQAAARITGKPLSVRQDGH